MPLAGARRVVVGALAVSLAAGVAVGAKRPTRLTGRVFRSDTGKGIAGAVVLVLDPKRSETKDRSASTSTDADGRYEFPEVEPGKYTVTIRAWYDRQEDAPCQLLMAKIAVEGSSALIMRDGARFVEQVFVEGYKVKSGAEQKQDFDLVCRSMFEE